MNKNTKILIGVGVVSVAGYFIYQQTQKKSFANATSKTGKLASLSLGGRDKYYKCRDGRQCKYNTYGPELDGSIENCSCQNHGGAIYYGY